MDIFSKSRIIWLCKMQNWDELSLTYNTALQSLDLLTSESTSPSYNWIGKEAKETGGLLLDKLNKRFMCYISILRQLGWSNFFFFYGFIENS